MLNRPIFDHLLLSFFEHEGATDDCSTQAWYEGGGVANFLQESAISGNLPAAIRQVRLGQKPPLAKRILSSCREQDLPSQAVFPRRLER